MCILEHVAIVIVKAGGEVGVATKTVVELGGEGVMMTAEGVGSAEAVEIGVGSGFPPPRRSAHPTPLGEDKIHRSGDEVEEVGPLIRGFYYFSILLFD